MTTTIVYGDVADGYLVSQDPSYATARNGPADSVNTGTTATYGQAGAYSAYQTFLRFAYPAVAAGDVVVSAAIFTFQTSQVSVGVARDLEFRGAAWGTSLDLADWRTPAQLSGAGLFGLARGIQASQNKWVPVGSENLRAGIQAQAFQELVLVSSRQRAGSIPGTTTDETSAIATADQTGTVQDPRLVFTTTPAQSLMPAMGGEVQLSDGSWVYLIRTGLSTTAVDIWRAPQAGAPVQVGSVPLGTTSTTWANVPALQGLTLAVDATDNLYVMGRAGDAPNSVRLQAWIKTSGSWAWTGGTIRTAGTPAHDAPVNNLTAAWHSTAGGTLVVFAAHAAGEGLSGGDPDDLVYLLASSQYLLTGAGSLVRASGSAQGWGLIPSGVTSSDFGGWTNEVGTGLDVVADAGQPSWGYVASFKRGQRVGDNQSLAVGRYILTATGDGFTHASYEDAFTYGMKDAGARIRLLAVGSGQVALVAADAVPGYGLSVEVLQASGTVAGLVRLGYVHLADETISTMPDGPAVAASPAWDAVYSITENAVWLYYVDVTTPTQLRRTSVDLNTYKATRVTKPVHTATSAISAVRVPRNVGVTQKGHVTVGLTPSGSASQVDTFNQSPLAPVLTPKANYDATAAGTFAWVFQDPNAGDTQSAYQLQVVRVSDGVTVLDTGKVASAVQSRNVAGGTIANGQDYRWRVMTWDALDAAGPWSPYSTFTASAGGSVTITTPAADNPPGVITDDYTITWSVTGTTQASYRYRRIRTDTGAVITDTGFTASTATTRTITAMLSDITYRIEITVRNAALVESNVATRLITPHYGSPEAPLVTLVPSPEEGCTLVVVDNPTPLGDRPEVVRNRIFRRVLGTTGQWEVLGTTVPDGTFRDFTAPSGTAMEYLARGETV